MKAKDGYKFIMVVTLPDGFKYAVGDHEGLVALVPIDETGSLKGVIAWNDSTDVKAWLDGFRKKNGEQNFKRWMSLKPEIGQVILSQ